MSCNARPVRKRKRQGLDAQHPPQKLQRGKQHRNRTDREGYCLRLSRVGTQDSDQTPHRWSGKSHSRAHQRATHLTVAPKRSKKHSAAKTVHAREQQRLTVLKRESSERKTRKLQRIGESMVTRVRQRLSARRGSSTVQRCGGLTAGTIILHMQSLCN